MLCVFLLLCAIHRPQSQTPFNALRYSLLKVFDEVTSSLTRAKTVKKIMLLPKPVDKITITSLPWPFPVQASIQLHCFPVEYSRSLRSTLSLIFWFCLDKKICSVPWNSPMETLEYLINGRTFWSNRNDPYSGIRTAQKGRPSVQAVSRCSRPNLLAVSLPSPAFTTWSRQSLFPIWPQKDDYRNFEAQTNDSGQVPLESKSQRSR